MCTLCARNSVLRRHSRLKSPFSALKNKRLFFARWYLIGIVPMVEGGRRGRVEMEIIRATYRWIFRVSESGEGG